MPMDVAGLGPVFDLTVELHQSAIMSLATRILNARPLANLHVKSPITRLISQPVPPLEILACWNNPTLAIEANAIELSAEVTGGARQVVTGRILTIEGTVRARGEVITATDASGRPYLVVQPPNPAQLNLLELTTAYAGSSWPPLLASFDPAKEATMLRPALATQLLSELAALPLTYLPTGIVELLPLGRPTAMVRPETKSVAMGLSLGPTRPGVAAKAISMLADRPEDTVAIGLSPALINRLISAQPGWERLAMTIAGQALQLSGSLRIGGAAHTVEAKLQCDFDERRTFHTRVVSGMADPVVVAAWDEMFLRLFGSVAFHVAGVSRPVQASATELVVSREQMILRYAIPSASPRLVIEIPPPRPEVRITQPEIPEQAGPRMPVTANLQATVIRDSTPPYDFAWTTDAVPGGAPHFGRDITLHTTPTAPIAGHGDTVLTIARLRVVDMFGQVVDTETPVHYVPYREEKDPEQDAPPASTPPRGATRRRASISGIMTILLVIAGGIAIARPVINWIDDITGPPERATVRLIPLASTATWRNASGPAPFLPGDQVDPIGYGKVGRWILEDGSSPEVIAMHPQWIPHGVLTGDFTLPAPIATGNRFRATIGFQRAAQGNVGACTFLVQAIYPDGTVSATLVRQFDTQADGRLHQLDVDLTPVVGALKIRLRVDAGESAAQDWAIWIDPRVE